MNPKSFMLILATAMVMLSSCGGKMSPYAYNEAIVGMHSKSWDYLNTRMEQIFDHENTSKEQAQLIIDSLNLKFDGYIKRLSEMNYPDGAEDFHKAATTLFVYVKDSVIPLYGETLNFEAESKDWYKVWNEIDKRLKGRADRLEDVMMREQQKFAAASGKRLR
jgi:hypothetical protein